MWRSSIGKKIIMAGSGLVWIGYLLLHMYGNLKVFAGPEAFNHYAESLRTLGEPFVGHGHALMLVRIVLTLSILVHVWAALALTRIARKARPVGYAKFQQASGNHATVTMRWGGLVLALFILYHLAHLTWNVPALTGEFETGNTFDKLVVGFHNPVTVGLYLLALVAVGLHLWHGGASFFQTMGWRTAANRTGIRILTGILAIAIPAGFAVVPLAVVAGLVA